MTNQVGVRTNCAKRKEWIERRWETAKWLTHPGRNVLVEVYREQADTDRHKATVH